VRLSVKRLEAELRKFVPAERYRPLLDQLLELINDAGSNGESSGPSNEPAQELA